MRLISAWGKTAATTTASTVAQLAAQSSAVLWPTPRWWDHSSNFQLETWNERVKWVAIVDWELPAETTTATKTQQQKHIRFKLETLFVLAALFFQCVAPNAWLWLLNYGSQRWLQQQQEQQMLELWRDLLSLEYFMNVYLSHYGWESIILSYQTWCLGKQQRFQLFPSTFFRLMRKCMRFVQE